MNWQEKSHTDHAWLWISKELGDSHERLLCFLLVPETNGKEVTVAALPAGALGEFPRRDVPENEPDLREVFAEIVCAPLGEVPLDAGLFGLDECRVLLFGLEDQPASRRSVGRKE